MAVSGGPLAAAPSFSILISVCCAILLRAGGYPAFAVLAAALLLLCSWVLLGSGIPPPGGISLFLTIVLISVIFSSLSIYRIGKKIILPSSVETTAKVLISRQWGKRSALLLSTPHGRFAAYVPGNDAPLEGSIVSIRGALFDFKRASKIGRSGKRSGFDEYLFWRARGAVGKLVALDIKVLEPPGGIHRWRNFITKRITEELPDNMSGYMLALTVGVRDDRLTRLHRSAGTTHLLAVSGFHVGILAAFLTLFFRKGRGRIAGISAVMWFYILLAGSPAGGIRAAVMLQVYMVGLLTGKPSSAFNSVSVAGLLLLLYNPWYFFDIGWRLSMIAALFLSAVSPLIKRGFLSAFFISGTVWFATAPQIVTAFEEAPIAGIFINSIAVPVFAVLFPLVFLLSLPSLFAFRYGWLIAEFGESLLELWEIFSDTIVRILPWSIVYTLPVMIFGAVLFGTASAIASGVHIKRAPFIALLFPIFILIFA